MVTAGTHSQRISRNSDSYEVALYEMAWAYIEAEQYDKALNTIDSLLLTVKDPQLDVEAHTLRGRLNIYLNDHDTAVDTFEKIISRFAPIRNELDKFTRDPKNIQRYFQWLIERRGEGGDLNAPMTPRTAAWVESTGEMKRMAGIFSELGQQSRELITTQDMAQMLETMVDSEPRRALPRAQGRLGAGADRGEQAPPARLTALSISTSRAVISCQRRSRPSWTRCEAGAGRWRCGSASCP